RLPPLRALRAERGTLPWPGLQRRPGGRCPPPSRRLAPTGDGGFRERTLGHARWQPVSVKCLETWGGGLEPAGALCFTRPATKTAQHPPSSHAFHRLKDFSFGENE